MQLTNSRSGYGLIAIAFHWTVAAAFLANYALIYGREWFAEPRSDFGRSLFSAHTAIGVSALVFIALRILWRFMSSAPDAAPGTPLEHLIARLTHFALYIVMLGLPLTGYLGFGGAPKLFFALEIPTFRETWVFTSLISGQLGISWESFEGVMDMLHKTGGTYVVPALIALHIGAALFHHLIRRDTVLRRMTDPSLTKGANFRR
jgi:cytochrome b561